MAKRTRTPRAPKGTPTALNIWTLGQHFGANDRAPNQLEATSVPGIRRCLKGGLVTVEARELVLTDEGRAALDHTGPRRDAAGNVQVASNALLADLARMLPGNTTPGSV